MPSFSRRVAVITGTRAEFGLLQPVLEAVARQRALEVQLIATGMHLLPQFGHTLREIRRCGWKVHATVRMQSGADEVSREPLAVARGIAGISRALKRLDSQMAVVLGDRIEAFAGASAAALSRIPVAHIHGGDRATGQTDEALRNTITRLAHVHLVASGDARRRLVRMGEEPWRIHRVGAPGLDDIWKLLGGTTSTPIRAPDSSSGELPGTCAALMNRPYAVILYHPCTESAAAEAKVMRAILSAVRRCGLAGLIIYPNSDPGHSGIIEVIRKAASHSDWVIVPSLARPHYVQLTHAARVMIGNSSSGIIESASLGVNAVNIGPRQEGRLRCGPHVLDVPSRSADILSGLRRAMRLGRPRPRTSVYGDGHAGQRIARILARLRIDSRLLRKRTTF